jgi:hypothetical protein
VWVRVWEGVRESERKRERKTEIEIKRERGRKTVLPSDFLSYSSTNSIAKSAATLIGERERETD